MEIHTKISTTAEIVIRPFSTQASDSSSISTLWHLIFPLWPIAHNHLRNILHHPLLASQGRHFIASLNDEDGNGSEKTVGFVLAYMGDEGMKGYVSVIGVLEEMRGWGVGSGLLLRACEALRGAAKEKGTELKNLGIGSETPRFWPGMPGEFAVGVGRWFEERGMSSNLVNFPVTWVSLW